MSQNWPALRAQLEAAVARHSFLNTFNALRFESEALRGFADSVALLDRLHHRDGDPNEKNAILRALVEAAQRKDAPSHAATQLLLLALWPGLDAARIRLRPLFQDALDDLSSEIFAELTRQVRRLRLTHVRAVAATVIRNVERDVRRRRIADLEKMATSVELDESRDATYSSQGVLTLLADAHDDDGLRRLEERIARLIGEDAALVVDIAVRHTPQREAAASRGLSHDAGRKRYQRAVSKLRAALAG